MKVRGPLIWPERVGEIRPSCRISRDGTVQTVHFSPCRALRNGHAIPVMTAMATLWSQAPSQEPLRLEGYCPSSGSFYPLDSNEIPALWRQITALLVKLFSPLLEGVRDESTALNVKSDGNWRTTRYRHGNVALCPLLLILKPGRNFVVRRKPHAFTNGLIITSGDNKT